MKSRGFTLIELLVVIAIIGLLGTLSAVSFSSSREKARLSKGIALSAQVLRSTGDDLVGRWDFDDCLGVSAIDSSGNGRSGAFSGTATWSTDTPTGKGCSVAFDGTVAAVTVPDVDAFSFTNNSFTVSLWMKAANQTSNIGMISKIGSGWEYSFYTYPSLGNVSFNAWTPAGAAVSPLTTSVTYDLKWNQFVISSDGINLRVYKDGSLVKTVAYSSGLYMSNTASTLRIGMAGDGGGNRYMNGLIDDVRLYGRALSSKEIHQMYVNATSSQLVLR